MPRVDVVRITIEWGNSGLFFATSQDMRTLLVGRPTVDETIDGVKEAIKAMIEVKHGQEVDVLYADHIDLVHYFVVLSKSIVLDFNNRHKDKLDAYPAYWTCSENPHTGPLYYFKITNAYPPPYNNQRHVDAILDIADDGTLAGVELVHVDRPPPPKVKKPSPPTKSDL